MEHSVTSVNPELVGPVEPVVKDALVVISDPLTDELGDTPADSLAGTVADAAAVAVAVADADADAVADAVADALADALVPMPDPELVGIATEHGIVTGTVITREFSEIATVETKSLLVLHSVPVIAGTVTLHTVV